jgi:hypothetical protein
MNVCRRSSAVASARSPRSGGYFSSAQRCAYCRTAAYRLFKFLYETSVQYVCLKLSKGKLVGSLEKGGLPGSDIVLHLNIRIPPAEGCYECAIDHLGPYTAGRFGGMLQASSSSLSLARPLGRLSSSRGASQPEVIDERQHVRWLGYNPIQPAVRLLHGLDSAPSMSYQIIRFWLTEFYSFDTVATNTTHGE